MFFAIQYGIYGNINPILFQTLGIHFHMLGSHSLTAGIFHKLKTCFFDFVIIIVLIMLPQTGTETVIPKGAMLPVCNFTHACKQFSD